MFQKKQGGGGSLLQANKYNGPKMCERKKIDLSRATESTKTL
jgi:hypothetical protein